MINNAEGDADDDVDFADGKRRDLHMPSQSLQASTPLPWCRSSLSMFCVFVLSNLFIFSPDSMIKFYTRISLSGSI